MENVCGRARCREAHHLRSLIDIYDAMIAQRRDAPSPHTLNSSQFVNKFRRFAAQVGAYATDLIPNWPKTLPAIPAAVNKTLTLSAGGHASRTGMGSGTKREITTDT